MALALLRRANGDDARRGRTLLRQGVAAGAAVGMTGLVARWRQAEPRDAYRDHATPPAVRMSQPRAGRWRVVHEDEVATVPDRVGMRYLARLVAAPDQSIPAVALAADAPLDARRPQSLLDRRALADVRDRLRDLRLQPSRSAPQEEELAALTRELARATGLGGRVRSFADVPERARVAVTKAIKRAIDEIAVANPAVGRHLAARVETGTVCRYRLEGMGRES